MRRFSKPRERWPKTKKVLTYFVLLLLVPGLAARSLARGALFYQSLLGRGCFCSSHLRFCRIDCRDSGHRLEEKIVKRMRDCTCLCHRGGVVVHIVACCDAVPTGLLRRVKRQTKKPPKKSK